MTIIQRRLQDFGFVCVENLYTNKELHHIKNEIQNMNYMMDSVPAIQEQRNKDSAKDEDGNIKMTGNGLMVDAIYNQRDYSSLLTFNRKIFMNQENNIGKKFQETHPSNVAYHRIGKDFTILNRYSYGDQYGAHFDYASFSAVTFLV